MHRQQSQQCAIGEEVVIGTTLTLKWERPFRPVSIEAEEKLLPLLLRYAEKERGMMNSHHPRRVQSIRDACRESYMTLDQALSMRRMHMMYLNPQISNTFQLHLGRPAVLFEHSVAQYLSRQGVRFLSEEQQKHHGPGAFVYSFGLGIRIKTMLEAEGAFVLDAKPLDLGQMRTHQRTWCANDRGHILPNTSR